MVEWKVSDAVYRLGELTALGLLGPRAHQRAQNILPVLGVGTRYICMLVETRLCVEEMEETHRRSRHHLCLWFKEAYCEASWLRAIPRYR